MSERHKENRLRLMNEILLAVMRGVNTERLLKQYFLRLGWSRITIEQMLADMCFAKMLKPTTSELKPTVFSIPEGDEKQ